MDLSHHRNLKSVGWTDTCDILISYGGHEYMPAALPGCDAERQPEQAQANENASEITALLGYFALMFCHVAPEHFIDDG